MILIKMKDTVINMDSIQGINRSDKNIEFYLPEDKCFRAHYSSEGEAKEAMEKLFQDLATTAGVDGSVLTGDYVEGGL